jgi:hypothetical protein
MWPFQRSAFLWFAGLLGLSGCARLDSIPYCCPQQTPETWCDIQPCLNLEMGWTEVVLVQPSSTILIYLLSLLTIAVGLYFLRVRDRQRSRLWWGIALLLWGAGAFFAGTSYEAFSYAIKCAGREVCVWTSWWEVAYLLLTVASVDAMAVAVAHSCTAGRWRRALSVYALVNAAAYAVAVLIGVLVPIAFLISFELMILFALPGFLILFILNCWRYGRLKSAMDLALLGTWLGLGVSTGAYFLYLESGLTQKLWAQGLWFSENDVLHIGLIAWMVYIALVVVKRVEDAPEAVD